MLQEMINSSSVIPVWEVGLRVLRFSFMEL
jgi:hypothetical protein